MPLRVRRDADKTGDDGNNATVSERIMSAVYRVTDKKCATCRWWNGERGIEFRANQPYYVKVGNPNSTCSARGNGAASAATVCPRWTLWEKL